MQSKILIVDDEPRICQSVKTLLDTQAYDVHTCDNGRTALKLMTETAYDLVLLDISMDDMDGFQVIEEVISEKIDTSVIIMTGNASIDSAVKALRMGANDYLRKPFEPEELFSSVKNILNQRMLKKENVLITRKLNESEGKFRQIYSNLLDVYFETNLEGIILELSPSIEKHTQYKREELIGKSFFGMFNNFETRDYFLDVINNNGNVQDFELTILAQNGAQHICSLNAELLNDQDGHPIKIVGLFRDITERKYAEDEKENLKNQLHQSQKMEAIGTLATGIAHDFNNILSGILGYTQLLEFNINNPEKAKKHANHICTGVQRATELVQQILTSSRRHEPSKHPVKIHLVVKETLKLLRSAMPSTIEIKEEFNSKATILADTTQIHQIIMNLGTNAYHAMKKKGGILSVNLEEVEIQKSDIVPDINIVPGTYLKLKVSDNGPGIEPEIFDKIFDPYFTTKIVGDGTGLGLAIVQRIVKEHDGYITAYSKPEKGTVFQVYLPLSDNQKDSFSEQKKNAYNRGTEKIMIVDDEESILASTKELLENYGYNVSSFSDGTAALKEFKKAPHQSDLIITDMAMPKMSGDRLSAEVTKIRPDIPILLCSGLHESMSEKRAIAMGITDFLQKPIKIDDLSRKIRKVLDNKIAVAQ